MLKMIYLLFITYKITNVCKLHVKFKASFTVDTLKTFSFKYLFLNLQFTNCLVKGGSKQQQNKKMRVTSELLHTIKHILWKFKFDHKILFVLSTVPTQSTELF